MSGSRRRSPGAALAALLAALLSGCGDASPEGSEAGAREGPAGVEVTDHQGRLVALPGPPERLVSLVPSATEILLELGAAPRLVGRTEYDTLPAVADLPSVGGGLEPSIEALVSLEPELVVRFEAESDPRTPERLDRAGIPHLAVRPDGMDEVREVVLMMGAVLDRREEADDLWRGIVREMEAAAEGIPAGPEPRVAFVLGGDPPLVAGADTFLDDLLAKAGARNAFSDLGSLYPPVSREELATREIRRVVAPEDAALPSLPPGTEVARVPGWVQRPGPRLGDATAELVRAVHGEGSGG